MLELRGAISPHRQRQIVFELTLWSCRYQFSKLGWAGRGAETLERNSRKRSGTRPSRERQAARGGLPQPISRPFRAPRKSRVRRPRKLVGTSPELPVHARCWIG